LSSAVGPDAPCRVGTERAQSVPPFAIGLLARDFVKAHGNVANDVMARQWFCAPTPTFGTGGYSRQAQIKRVPVAGRPTHRHQTRGDWCAL
jgi:hypothetical protein